jgi:hypothetical protein
VTIELPALVVVAQWVLLAGLAVLVLLMYRQLAWLLRLASAESEGGGLAPGERAPSFEFKRWRGTGPADGVFDPSAGPAVLAFAEPYCKSCAEMLSVLERITRRSRAAGLRVLVVTDGHRRQLDEVEAFRDTPLDVAIVDRDVTQRLFLTTVTPFLYGVGAEGAIEVKGVGSNEADVRVILGPFADQPDPSEAPDALRISHHNGQRPEERTVKADA